MNKIIERASRLPVGVIGTAVGAVTLGNVYAGMLGLTYPKHIFSVLGMVVFILAAIKLSVHRKVFVEEFKTKTVLGSLYGTFSMLSMLLGAYLLGYNEVLGKTLWYFGVFFHAILIIVFTYTKMIRNFNINGFAPSWFVTYNGIMVSIVIGGKIDAPLIKEIVLIYGFIAYFCILPFMIRRLVKYPLPDQIVHTKTILLAPVSLCLVSYLAVVKNPNLYIVTLLYAILFIKIIAILLDFPKFFSFKFGPGFAALTFPMAIAVVASLKVSIFLGKAGYANLGLIVRNITGLQIFITSFVILFVYYNFLKLVKTTKK